MLSKSRLRQIKKEVSTQGDKLTTVFSALSDRGRLNMFKLLLKHNDLCVTDIATIFNISVPAASQQLKIMEQSGLVEKERMGQMTCYSVKKSASIVKLVQKAVTL
jgi:DNA-binding transcriptional ArsR family regulator